MFYNNQVTGGFSHAAEPACDLIVIDFPIFPSLAVLILCILCYYSLYSVYVCLNS